jgi:hypothetical protein
VRRFHDVLESVDNDGYRGDVNDPAPPPAAEAPPLSPRWSADHKSWWDGARWFRLSDDGHFWWDGTSWIPRQQVTTAPPATKEGWNVPVVITIGVILVVIVVGYVAWHLYEYRNCIFTPSLMDWPSSCL